jgi:glycosyltransferase involved in cell wall biosynthesis
VYARYPFDPRVRKEAETLRDGGVDVEVLCVRGPGEAAREEVNGVAVHRLPLAVRRGSRGRYVYQYAVFFLLAALRLLALRLRRRFDVVHVHSLPDFLVFAALPVRPFVSRIVLDLHEAMPEIYRARFPRSGPVGLAAAKTLETLSCLVADRVIVVNDTIRDLLSQRGVPPSKLTVVMNSPRPAMSTAGNGPAPRPSWAHDGAPVLVYVGGLNPERDLVTLLKAHALAARVRPLAVALYGYGPAGYREALRRTAETLETAPSVHLGGYVDPSQVPSTLARSAVGVVPYERNALTEVAIPNKLFEYVAVSKPLVVADLRAMRTLLGDAALYYRPGDAADLAGKILRLLEDVDLRSTLVERARRVHAACRWEVMAERLLSVYYEQGGRRG